MPIVTLRDYVNPSAKWSQNGGTLCKLAGARWVSAICTFSEHTAHNCFGDFEATSCENLWV